MDYEKRKKLKEVLTKIEKAHRFYIKTDNINQAKLMKSCQFLFDQLESFGLAQHFGVTLLCYGKEFLEFEYREMIDEDENAVRMAEELFGARVDSPDTRKVFKDKQNAPELAKKETLTSPEKKTLVFEKLKFFGET